MYVQYNLNDPNPTAAIIQASTSQVVDPTALADAGRGQLLVDDSTNLATNVIDFTQDSPVLIPLGQ